MYKCLFVLAVLGVSTCYHHHGHSYYPAHPSYPSYNPSQAHWSQPGHSGHPYGDTRPDSWIFNNGNWQHRFGWHNPSGGSQMDYSEHWPNKPSQTNDNTGQWPPNPTQTYNPSQTGFNWQDQVSDHQQSDNAPDSGNVSSETADQLKNPFIFNGQDSGLDLNESSELAESVKDGQDGTSASQTDDQANNPFIFNDQDSGLDLNASGEPAESEKDGQDGTSASQTDDQAKNPLIFNNPDSGLDLNESSELAESEKDGQNGTSASQTDDQAKNPFIFNDQGSGLDLNESSELAESEKDGQDGTSASQTDDQAKNPFVFNDQDSGLDLNESSEPAESEKGGQDGTSASQTDGQAKNPFDFLNNNQNDTTSEPERIGLSVNIPNQTANPDSKPFEFNSQETDTQNGAGIPSESSDINQDVSNTSLTADSTNNQTANPVLKPLNETNKTLSQAFITGPNFPYTSQANATSGKATLQPSRAEAPQPASVKIPEDDEGTTINDSPDVSEVYTTLAPRKGSEPVPFLEQFLAPSLQWHVGIYKKTETPYSHICGGSLVKTDVVLTAAHCFWSEHDGALRPALFAAAAGKVQRAWDASSDAYAQKSDITEINIPPRFRGAKANFQDDIAIARLSTPFEYAPGVKPVCVDFDLALERKQLQSGSQGTVVGWGLTKPYFPPSERLNFLALEYIDIERCVASAHWSFLIYITSDKICAADPAFNTAVCKDDSGDGLVYTDGDTPYLRGIASTAYRRDDECNVYMTTTFTHITAHSTFLADHVPNIAEGCRTLYEARVGTNETEGSTLVTTDSANGSSSGDPSAGNVGTQLQPNVIRVQEGGNSSVVPVPLPLITGN